MKRVIIPTSLTLWTALWTGGPLFTITTSMAFCPATTTSTSTKAQQSSVALHLVPGQGNQLVAAYNSAACSKQPNDDNENDVDDDVDEDFNVQESATAETQQPNTAGNFVQRAFQLPNVMRTLHLKKQSSMLEQHSQHSKNQDIVIFPLVGFTFCRNGDRVVPLPTQSNVSCRLPTRDPSGTSQEVYGWYSPICKLDLYHEDTYCQGPSIAEQDKCVAEDQNPESVSSSAE